MGIISKGKWIVDGTFPTVKGKFVRKDSAFRSTISRAEGSKYLPEKGRYHLYVSLACPWAHRTLIFRALKGLEDIISVSVVKPHMLDNGWEFDPEPERAHSDALFNEKYLYNLYLRADPEFEGRVTVPVLWDKQTNTIVNNESSEIIRIFNSAFNELTGNREDYYPEALRPTIDAINERVYPTINNGVYKAGFATSQGPYEEAYTALFDSLDWLEDLLGEKRYLAGGQQTEADWRLFTTLVRFDAVYHGHFKCNRQKLSEFPNLSNYLRDLYQTPQVAGTVDMEQIKQHYYYSHAHINPTRVVPLGGIIDFSAPHNRGDM